MALGQNFQALPSHKSSYICFPQTWDLFKNIYILKNLPYPSAANDLIILGFVWSEYFLVLLLCSCDLLNYKQETNPRIIRHSAWNEEEEKNKNLMLLNTRMSFLITGSQDADSNSEHLSTLCIKIRIAMSLWDLFFMAWMFWGQGKWQMLLTTVKMGMSHKFLKPRA